jgi:two-component system, OmpR family, copper resistance phosphate regulon response regulator CusR
MIGTKILIVEDEVKLLMAMHQWLTERQFIVETASDAKVALELARNKKYSVIVCDIVMPQMTGLDFLRQIRNEGILTPVILLTALSDMEDKVEGFEAGADDYLTKPFDFQELTLRIMALARRPIDTYKGNNMLVYDKLVLNLATKEVIREGKIIALTPREYDLVEYFLRNPERVISKLEIAEKVWKLDFDTGTNVIEVYVNFLRKKIDNGFEKKLIHTQYKIGYILRNADSE